MRRWIIPAVAAAVIALGASAPPRLPINDLKNLPIVAMTPYDEKADANAVVAAAFARARKSHKPVLLDLGGNWCPDCLALANVMRLPVLQKFLAAHYEVAAIDVGRFDKNLQIPARFGLTDRLKGVPTILVATPEGKLINRGHVFALSDASQMTPQALAAYLAEWTN